MMKIELMTYPAIFPLQLNGLSGMSENDFFHFCQLNPDLQIERKANKEIIIIPPAGANSGRFCSEINGQLYVWNHQKKLGFTFDSSAGFTMPDGSVKSPDAAWIEAARWSALSQEARDKFAPIAPDFVAEVASLSDSIPQVQNKMQEYMENGVRLGFLIIPHQEKAYIYRANGTVALSENFEEKLDGEEVLPGFQLDLSRLR